MRRARSECLCDTHDFETVSSSSFDNLTLHSVSVEAQRELVRGILHVILDAGYSPMKFFAKDYKKYFYLAELCSLVDLSAVIILRYCYAYDPQPVCTDIEQRGTLAEV